MPTEEALRIIALEKDSKAAKILGLKIEKVRYYKRRIREGHIKLFLPAKQRNASLKHKPWTPKEDRILKRNIVGSSIRSMTKILHRTKEEIQARLDLLLDRQKAKLPIIDILISFPDMSSEQIQQMKMIYAYSPKSALRYCKAIQKYRQSLKDANDTEQINSF